MRIDILKRSPIFEVLAKRLKAGPQLIQAILGPRQVGKTTTLRAYLESAWPNTYMYISADGPTPPTAKWLAEEWERARSLCRLKGKHCILALDEVQKIPRWSEVIKACFDEDRYQALPLTPVILGSSALIMERGLSESLAGRFEVIPCPHWSFSEVKIGFGYHLRDFLLFGGYPAGYGFIQDFDRWQAFISDSIIETTVSRDILSLAPIEKPALLRQAFALACSHPAQILTYQKFLGQLVDAGNTTTIANYLNLLAKAFLIASLPKWSGKAVRQRASSPKLIILNNALITATLKLTPQNLVNNAPLWGHIVENAVGAHLINAGLNVQYWREGNTEVDFVVVHRDKLIAIEVTSGEKPNSQYGFQAFSKKYTHASHVSIGGNHATWGIEQFLMSDPRETLALE
jgi:predicted AAA+ superfamily ATPase